MIQQMSRPLQLLKDTLPETNSQRAPPKNGWLGPERGHNSSQNLHDFQGVQADSFREGIPPPNVASQIWRLQLLSAHVGDAEPKWSEMPSQKLHKFKAWGWQFEPGTGDREALHFDSKRCKSFLEIGPFFSYPLRIQTPNSKIPRIDGV